MSLEQSIEKFIKLQASENNLEYHLIVSVLFELLYEISVLEKKQVNREKILYLLKEVRSIAGQSPFINRMQTWPCGYPGDYQTIEYLIKGKNKAKQGTVEFFLEQYCLYSPAAQQHRNKVLKQSELILQLIDNQKRIKRPIKILSLACGSCPDVRLIKELIKTSLFEFTFVDYDNNALEFSKSKLTNLKNSCMFIKANVLKLPIDLMNIGPFDLIITGGLFDYLKNQQIIFILTNIWDKMLAAQGKCFFTNISYTNPERILMEYIASWLIIPRSENDIKTICSAAKIPNRCTKIYRDTTQITIMVEIEKHS